MDPLTTLRGHDRSVSSVCFVQDPFSSPTLHGAAVVHENSTTNYNDDERETERKYDNLQNNDDDINDLMSQFRCNKILSSSSRRLTREHDSESVNINDDSAVVAPYRDGDNLRNRAITKAGGNNAFNAALATATSLSVDGALIASCDTKGTAYIWDIMTRRIVSQYVESPTLSQRRGPGLAIRNLESSSTGYERFLYHTRGENGIVSIHDLSRSTADNVFSPPIIRFSTRSKTFCTAAPCMGDANLVALPSENEACATVRDLRMDPNHRPAMEIHGSGGRATLDGRIAEEWRRKHGMLTSLAMISAPGDSNSLPPRPILVCGMESGETFFHDCAGLSESCTTESMLTRDSSKSTKNGSSESSFRPRQTCSVKIGRDPILCQDLALSRKKGEAYSSVVAIAGSAGDAAELSSVPEEERGTVSITRVSFFADENRCPTARIKSRIGTCQIGDYAAGGKPGVASCRFRSDGKIFAVGGWDRRGRVFSREGKPLAILRAHSDSVTAVDWAKDSSTGLLATGSADGRISIWSVYPSTKR